MVFDFTMKTFLEANCVVGLENTASGIKESMRSRSRSNFSSSDVFLTIAWRKIKRPISSMSAWTRCIESVWYGVYWGTDGWCLIAELTFMQTIAMCLWERRSREEGRWERAREDYIHWTREQRWLMNWI